MSKKDRLNNEISSLNIYLAAVLAAIIGVVGFIFASYESTRVEIIICAAFGVLCLLVSVLVIQSRMNKKNNEIERL
nr:hypothetical protein [uncultured Campylobacter sp.]